MLVIAFVNVDHYTGMSLCDVIYHAITCFKEQAFDLALAVAPILVKQFNVTD